MKYHYRTLIDDPPLLEKLQRQENACLQSADQIITVSQVNRRAIEARALDVGPIAVIANGVDLDQFPLRPDFPGARAGGTEGGPCNVLRIAYVGTLTAWQGVELLIESLGLLQNHCSAELTLLGAGSKSRLQALRRHAATQGVLDQVAFLPPGDSSAVCTLLHQADATVVPLLAVDRNTQQGCCPLKLLEAMATGCPIVAANLPVILELATPMEHFLPFRAGDARNLKNTLLQLASAPHQAQQRAHSARAHVTQHFTWQHATDQLCSLYEQLLKTRQAAADWA